MDAQIGQLAYSAANAAVAAMGTDGWKAAKALFRRLRRGHRHAGPDELVDLLEEWRTRLEHARERSDAEEYWKCYEEIWIALTLRFARTAADDAAARTELQRLRAEWLALPGVAAQVAGSEAYLARTHGELLEEPKFSPDVPLALVRSEPACGPSDLVPAITTQFTDRDEILDRLFPRIGRSESRIRFLNLYGEGGIGKTTLAVHLAETVASSFPDGTLYVDLQGSTGESALEPAAALEQLLRALGADTSRISGSEQRLRETYRGVTAKRRFVILLDDAASITQVRPLISASPGSLTVVTSRDPLPGLVQEFGATTVHVPRLDDANSLKLLRRVAGLDDSSNPAASSVSAAEVEAVIRRCAGLPLAVCIAAAAIAVGRFDPDEYLESSEAAAELGHPELLAGYRSLPPEAVRLHRLLCARPWPSISAGPAAAAIGADADTAGVLLQRLFDEGLLIAAAGSPAGKPSYRVPKLVREEARRLVRTPHDVEEAAAATRAMVCWYLAFAVFADWEVNSRWRLGPLYVPLSKARDEARRTDLPEPRRYVGKAAALEALDGQFGNLVEAVQAAAYHQFHDLVPQLCEAMWGFFLMRGRFSECVTVHRLGVVAAVATGDLKMQARMRVQLAFGLLWQERFDEAEGEFERGLAADREADHDQGLATALESIGLVRLARGEFTRAAELFLEARVYADRVGDPRAVALLHYHYARALSGLGRFDEAEAEFDLASAKFVHEVRPRDEYNEAKILMGRGQVALRAGQPEQAHALLAKAAEAMAENGELVVRGQIDVLRAWCAQQMGDLAAERAFLVEAQELYARTGSGLAPKVLDRINFLDAATSRS